jgi:MFS family permease
LNARLKNLWTTVATNFRRPLYTLYILVFLKQLGNGMVWSMIAVFGQSLGATPAIVGLMVSSFGGARLIVNVPSGMASERFGRRRMMILGCVLIGVSAWWAAYSTTIAEFFCALMIMGVASSSFVTSALAAVVDLGDPKRRIQDMSGYQAANLVGTSMGPALGGWAAGIWGLHAPFTFNGIMAILGIIAFSIFRWSENKEKAQAQKTPRGQLLVIARRSVGIGLMWFSLFYVRVSSNWILMPLLAQSRFGMPLSDIGMILTAGAITNLVCLPFNAPLARRIGRVAMILLSACIALIAVAMLAFGGSPVHFWIASILFGVSGSISSPTLTAYVADIAPPDQRGPAMGMLRTMQDGALILGPSCTGFLADNLGLGFQGGFLGCFVLLSLSSLIFAWYAWRQRAA